MEKGFTKIKNFLNYCILILLLFLFLLLSVWIVKHQPHIIKDYGNFAIVEMDGEVYIWNKDIYGDGTMLRMDSKEVESEVQE